MKVIAFNGSPRKKWNTATLLENVLDGARAKGAQCELVHLYDVRFKGCVSCFECKKLGGKSYGRCAVQDGLTGLLERAAQADAVVVGSPVYFGTETGEARSLLERLIFPYYTYTPQRTSLFGRTIPTALVYTMNVPETMLEQMGYTASFERMRDFMGKVYGSCEVLLSTDTYQFTDYSKYLSTVWDPEAKARRRAEVFPQDCSRARVLGERLAASTDRGSDAGKV